MYTKEKGNRNYVPVTPDFHSKKMRSGPWLSIGSAIILISLVVAILLGFWAITF